MLAYDYCQYQNTFRCQQLGIIIANMDGGLLQDDLVLDLHLSASISKTKNDQLPAIKCTNFAQLNSMLTNRNAKYKQNRIHPRQKRPFNRIEDQDIFDGPSTQQTNFDEKVKGKCYDANTHELIMESLVENFAHLDMALSTASQDHKIQQPSLPQRVLLLLEAMDHSLEKYYKQNQTCKQKIDSISLLQSICQNSQLESLPVFLQHLEALRRNEYGLRAVIALVRPSMDFVSATILKKQCKKRYQNRWEQIFWTILSGKEGREKLGDILFIENDRVLYGLVKGYDQMLNGAKIITQNQLRNHDQSVQMWISQDFTNPFRTAIGLILRSSYSKIKSEQLWPDHPSTQLTEFKRSLVLLLRTLAWLQVQFEDDEQAEVFYRQKMAEYNIHKDQVIEDCLHKLGMKQRLQVCFSMFSPSRALLYEEQDPLNQINLAEKLVIYSALLNEKGKLQPFFGLMDPLLDFKQVEAQLKLFLTRIIQTSIGFNFVPLLFPFLEEGIGRELILINQDTVEMFPWKRLALVIPEKQLQNLLVSVIKESIRRFKNAAAFINSALVPAEMLPPFFDIQVMVEGMKQVMTGETSLTLTDRAKYFGMISVFRGQDLPAAHVHQMVWLELLFEWFILRESIQNRDFKSLSQSLTFNLEEYSEEEQVNTASFLSSRGSTRGQHVQSLHSGNYTHQMWSRTFLRQAWRVRDIDFFIGFLNSIMEGLILVRIQHKKSVRRSKLESWVESFQQKIRESINLSSDSTLQNLLNSKRIEYSQTFERISS